MNVSKMAKLAFFLAVFAYLSEANDVSSSDDKLSEILKRGKIIVATEPEYPPMSELIKGAKRSSVTKCFSNEYTAAEYTGFEIELANEVAKHIGVEPCFVNPAWIEIIAGKWADRWDISFDSISITSERMESLYFAQPYTSEPSVFYIHKNNEIVKHFTDLSGKKIGVSAGSIFEHYLEGTLTLPGQKIDYRVKNSEIIGYNAEIDSFRELALGDGVKINALLSNIFVGNKALTDGMPIKQLGEPVFYTYIAPVIDKKQKRDPISFINKINEIIMKLHDNGTLLKLAQKYIHLNTDVVTPAKNFNVQVLEQYH